MSKSLLPLKKINLYDSSFEHENCGIGFIASIKKNKEHKILTDALEMLARMEHRGGCGCEENTGDGAGIMTDLSNDFFIPLIKKKFNTIVTELEYAIGNVFFPRDSILREKCEKLLINEIKVNKQKFIGFRDVDIDVNKSNIGETALKSMPIIKQIIIKKSTNSTIDEFCVALYIIRKYITHLTSNIEDFHICSLSNILIVYKGMLTSSQLKKFYCDLQNTNYKPYLSIVHSRFSTNTFPSWSRAQPSRYMSHNGEINTRSGNHNWMSAREGSFVSNVLGDNLAKILPVIEKNVSDSGSFDNALEFLMINGRTLAESILMMVPEAWHNDVNMDKEKKTFYKYLANMMEPWDGPASIAFTDGHQIGAILDRNGLRPSRYYQTFDDKIIMASEVGVVDIEITNIKTKGRLLPGKMFLIDFDKQKLIDDDEIKHKFAKENPYQKWLDEEQIYLTDLKDSSTIINIKQNKAALLANLITFNYTTERIQFMLKPLVLDGRDPVGSMGNDAALACLSDKSRLIYDYFKQIFAQVTNPAIDSIREEAIMSLRTTIGPNGNLLKNSAKNAARLVLGNPIITNNELLKIKNITKWKTKVIDITCSINNKNSLKQMLANIIAQADQALAAKIGFIILSDRATNKKRIPISALMAAATLHHHLVKSHNRTKISIIVETGEAAEVHHFCTLIGYGVDAINPYLAFDVITNKDFMGDILYDDKKIITNYIKSINKGILKVIAKMGISTLESYKGAQIFEIVGIAKEVVDFCFFGTQSRIEGVGFAILKQEMSLNHNKAYKTTLLNNDGQYHWRNDGEIHMWAPEIISNLQLSAKNNNKDAYMLFADKSNNELTKNATLRGLMAFKDNVNGISIDEVESAKKIVKRFVTGAMSFGSISKETHESLAIAMNKLGGKSNTGEGGEAKDRWKLDTNGDNRRSAIKQVASGRFGVDIEYLNNADEIQIKVTQGAKPGEGGELPGKKVDKYIAKLRHSTVGVGLISPPPHHDIYSIEDLSQLIFDLKRANKDAQISVKLVAGTGVGTIAAGVVKAKADHIVIAGHDGGTGASPLTSIKHAGLPWEIGLAETHQTLVMNNLRSRVTLQTDGQIKTGRDVAIATLLGAEEYGFSTAPLITLGCLMMRKCHLNTCPVGIATQDIDLRKKFTGKPEYVVNYLFMVAEEMRIIMAKLGFKTINDMVGRSDMLIKNKDISCTKQQNINLDRILKLANSKYLNVITYKNQIQDHKLNLQIDNKLINIVKDNIKNNSQITIKDKISNTDRAVGTMLSSFIVKNTGSNSLKDNSINLNFTGHAGQSLGAFLANGVNITVIGDANDYVGKGLSGGRIAIYPPKNANFIASNEIIAGNVCGYGAIAGEIYLSGIVADRFCVRNSGAIVVAEGAGDHALEYMTGGKVLILGEVGRNLGAGMSGGIAYIYNPNNTLTKMYNPISIDLETLNSNDTLNLKQMLTSHINWAKSNKAKRIIDNFSSEINNFVKIMPKELKKILTNKV